MRIKTVLLMFGLLFVVGMATLAVETWAGVPVAYEVTMSAEMAAQLPDEFSTEALQVMLEMGWLCPMNAEQLDTVEGQYCHLVVWWNGNDCWVDCILGRGSVRCPCWYSPDPSVK